MLLEDSGVVRKLCLWKNTEVLILKLCRDFSSNSCELDEFLICNVDVHKICIIFLKEDFKQQGMQ